MRPLLAVLLLLAAACGASAQCPGGYRNIPSTKYNFAYSVCYGEWQKYADAVLCNKLPTYLTSTGMKSYRVALEPICWNGKGAYICEFSYKNPCKRNRISTGAVTSDTQASCRNPTYPAEVTRVKGFKNPGRLTCDAGWRPSTLAENNGWGGEKLGIAGYCTDRTNGFEYITIDNIAACIKKRGNQVAAQGRIRWSCDGRRGNSELVMRAAGGYSLVCPWTFKAVYN